MDRTKEHLGTADAAVIRARRRFLNMAIALRDRGIVPAPVDHPELFRVRSTSTVLAPDVDWKVALADWHSARSTVLPNVRKEN